MKTCSSCKISKPLTMFGLHDTCAGGRRGQCKDCMNTGSYKAAYERIKNKPYYKERHKKEAAKHRKLYPEKHRARTLAKKIPLGKECQECGAETTLHRHHPDYSKPLEVIILCVPCHEAVHHRKVLV